VTPRQVDGGGQAANGTAGDRGSSRGRPALRECGDGWRWPGTAPAVVAVAVLKQAWRSFLSAAASSRRAPYQVGGVLFFSFLCSMRARGRPAELTASAKNFVSRIFTLLFNNVRYASEQKKNHGLAHRSTTRVLPRGPAQRPRYYPGRAGA